MAIGVSTRRWLRRTSSAASIVAIVVAAVGLPTIAPERAPGASSVVAIARADCPPDCGGGPGNGGTPSGPPGGGTEFVPPSMPAMPPYEAGRGYPPPDQNNGISIYNSAAPQPSQAVQPSQAPVQNQDGSYNRAANGEQQPVNYDSAPNNQEVSDNWRTLQQRVSKEGPENDPGGDSGDSNDGSEPDGDGNRSRQVCELAKAQAAAGEPLSDLSEFEEDINTFPFFKRGDVSVKISPPDGDFLADSGLTADDAVAIVHDAMDAWNQYSQAKFVDYAGASGTPDITVTWEDWGVMRPIPPEPGTDPSKNKMFRAEYAPAEVTNIAADLGKIETLTINELIVNTARLPELKGNRVRMLQLMIHELGHSLGLGHSCKDTVMDASGNPFLGGGPALLDIAVLQQIQAS